MYYVGIDLGGTNIKAGLVDEKGKIIAKGSVPTLPMRHYSEIIADMAGVAKSVAAEAGVDLSEIKSVGIGSPGTCDNKNGVLVYANNINFKLVPMRTEMQKHIDKPVYIGNDADCAAWGEYSMLEKKADNVVFVTLGTGVGGGFIFNGNLYTGFNAAAAEVGHMCICIGGKECTCGRKGCWEAYASVTALIRMTREYALANPDSEIAKRCGKNAENASGRTAFDAAREGDEGGKSIVAQWTTYVGEGIVNLINLLQPEILMIGGAISNEGDFLLDPVKEVVKTNRYTRDVPQTEIKIAKYGNDAGLIGAAFLGR